MKLCSVDLALCVCVCVIEVFHPACLIQTEIEFLTLVWMGDIYWMRDRKYVHCACHCSWVESGRTISLEKKSPFCYLSSHETRLPNALWGSHSAKNLGIKLINQSICMYGILFRLVRARHNIHLINGERSKSKFSIIDESRELPPYKRFSLFMRNRENDSSEVEERERERQAVKCVGIWLDSDVRRQCQWQWHQ